MQDICHCRLNLLKEHTRLDIKLDCQPAPIASRLNLRKYDYHALFFRMIKVYYQDCTYMSRHLRFQWALTRCGCGGIIFSRGRKGGLV